MSSALNTPQAVKEALQEIPPDQQQPTFNAPWEAQAFALTLALHKKGLFSWHEWSETLGAEIKVAQAKGDPDLGGTYYHHWLSALECLIQKKGITDQITLQHYQEAWHRAAHRTPHGEPIVLLAEDRA